MTDPEDFHHYKGSKLTPAEKVERRFVELILASNISDDQRASSLVWELKHSSGCCQIARILAQKRGLNIETGEVACLLHDIYVALEGKAERHAVLGAPMAEKLLNEVGGFNPEQIATIVNAIAHHSEKDIYSDDPYVELVKDVDVFDCSLYKGAENYYRIHKSPEMLEQYVKRVRGVRKELGLSPEDVFRA
ncbi:MAG TPA: HD domain-containing protein [Candidatus Saccharimonadales bacterium]|nr:HD domain-containing protein [Candidatus Saccharimonadales bacterium]